MDLIVREYLGSEIEFKMIYGKVYANATSIAKAFENGSQKLSDWKRSSKTIELINELETMEKSHSLIISEEGRNGGTWIEENLLLDFASYLNVKFKIWINTQITTLLREGEVSLKPKSEEEMILELFPSTDSNLVMLTANTIRENKQLKVELKEERDFISHVVHNETYYITPTSMANKFGLSAVKLNKILEELNVQYKSGKKWCLKTGYYGIGDYTYFQRPDGEWIKGTSLHYSNDGERVIYKLLKANGYETSN